MAPPHAVGMMFSEPSIPTAIDQLAAEGVDQLVVVGLFPHYSFATSGSAYTMVHEALVAAGRQGWLVHYSRPFFDRPGYLEAVAQTIRPVAAALPGEGPIDLLFSAHGVPVSFLDKGDPYADQIQATCRGVVDALGWTDPHHLSWQSRLGPTKWLTPSTPTKLEALAHAGRQRVIVVPISFVGEHIETLDELDREIVPEAVEAGIPHVGRAPALGHLPAFLDLLADELGHALQATGQHHCVRCALPKPEEHRRQAKCPNCRFTFPAFLRDGTAG